MKYVLIILTFLLVHVNDCCHGQDKQVYNIKMEYSEYYIGDTIISNTALTIKNNSSCDIILWLSDRDINYMTIEDQIKDYFFLLKGDFSLFHLMTENVASLPSPILFVSFFKYLAPKESFSINIISNGHWGNEQEMKAEKLLLNRINVGEIASFKNLIDIETLINFSYKADFICLELERF